MKVVLASTCQNFSYGRESCQFEISAMGFAMRRIDRDQEGCDRTTFGRAIGRMKL